LRLRDLTPDEAIASVVQTPRTVARARWWCRTWKGAEYPPKASRTVYGRRRDQLEVAGTAENLR
jgi:hypothetical protein